MNHKEKFLKAVEHIKRDGSDNLMTWLQNETDFFSAPASTNFHGNYEGGLVEHTVNVLEFALTNFNFLIKRRPELEYMKESVIISALFHDVCKTNCYVKENKWTKNSDNRWVEYLGWAYKDGFPIGHGEKSVYMISKYMELKDCEALAIRWHMGTYEAGTVIEGTTKWSYGAASEHPLVKLIHSADLMAITLETTINYKENASK